MTLWPGAQRFGLAVFLLVCTVLIVTRAPSLSVAGVSCTLSDGAWLLTLFAGVMLASLAVDLVALRRFVRGRDAALMDVAVRDGGAAPAPVARRTKWLVLYPWFIGLSLFFLWRLTPPACG